MRQLRAILDGYPGHPVLLGESPTADIESLSLVYGKNHDEVQLPMDFMVGDMKELTAAELKKNIDEAETKLGGTATLFFSSHDHDRQFSLFGDGAHNPEIARISAAATLLPGGTTLLYYGEELGMATMAKADLAGVPLGPKRPRADDRDGERTPMQWTPGPQAGFTSGTPWLPVQAAKTTMNAETEASDSGSLLHWYQSLIALHKMPAFATGAYLPLQTGNKQVFAFARKPQDGSEAGALVVMNVGPQTQQVRLRGAPLRLDGSTVLLASPATEAAPRGTSFAMPPFGVLVTTLRLTEPAFRAGRPRGLKSLTFVIWPQGSPSNSAASWKALPESPSEPLPPRHTLITMGDRASAAEELHPPAPKTETKS